ncbi:MAG: hypothetical protein GX249_10225 [Firmicutes bacterium]|nr:hypothetical protein [Bacillota bacterium]
MPFDVGSTRIFHCPACDVDTPHTIKTSRGDMYGIVCTNCHGGAIVSALDLRIYQLRWEEELQAILDSLVEHPLQDDDR